VKLFLMAKNEWTLENRYPLPQTQYKKMFLQSGGHANSSRGDGRLSWKVASTSKSDHHVL